MEPIPQTWNGAADFGRTVTCNINRNGDLITNMYLQVQLPAVAANHIKDSQGKAVAWGYVPRLGHALIQETKVEIGGSKIDEQYGDWLNIWYELSHQVGQERGYARMIGDVDELKKISTNAKSTYVLYVPFQYWFNRNNGLALPLIALQYHDVRVTVQLNSWENCVNWVGSSNSKPTAQVMTNCQLLIDYVYLDSEERKRFAQASHEYLIEQLQFTGSESITSVNNKYRLNFNHPSKYLIWVPHMANYNSRNTWAVHALAQGSWDAASNQLAEMVALANSSATCVDGVVKVTVLSTTNPASDPALTGLFTLNKQVVVNSSTTPISDMWSRVSVVCRPSPGQVSAALGNGLYSITVGQGDSNVNAWQDAYNNCVVVSNSLTSADLSYPVDNLKGGSTVVCPVLDQNAPVHISTYDQFNYGNFLDGTDNPVIQAKIQLNGHDRFQVLDGYYFNYVQPYQHFSNTPADGINVYSFALKAQDHQPTGTCNFSRIDNATLQVDLGIENNWATASAILPAGQANATYNNNFLGANASLLNIYTVNYNVLRVMSGMAGTAYSN